MAGAAMAVPPSKTLTYEGGGAGAVTFDGKIHQSAGLKCNDCHAGTFKMKQGSTDISMKAINAGQACGACHNGERAFKASDAANCAKCHTK